MERRKVKPDKSITRFYTEIYTFKYLRRLERMIKKSKKGKSKRLAKLEDFVIKKANKKANKINQGEILPGISGYGIKPFYVKQDFFSRYDELTEETKKNERFNKKE